MKFFPLGGADEIGASCYYINIGGTGILLDCGIHPQKQGKESLPDFEKLSDLNLDYVIISHAHQDHIGALPFLIKIFPHIKIIATSQTIDVAKLTLHNAANILKEQFSSEDFFPTYTHEEVDLLLRSVIELEYNELYEITGLRHDTGFPIVVELFDAGHIIGSASILLTHGEERIFYTGDIKLSRQSLLAGATLPDQKVTTLITETTYGSTNTKLIGNLNNEIKRFTSEANKILSDGGSILIPVFALGKMQEIISIIFKEMESGKLTDVPVFTGGIGNRISRVYDKNRYLVNYVDTDFLLSNLEVQNYFEINDFNHFKKHSSIIIASSGMMLENTSSYRFAKFWLRQKSFAIFIVGYMDSTTFGFKISNSSEGDKIEVSPEEVIEIKCKINKFFFPTHSKREEIVKIFEKLRPDNVIMIHGEDESKNWVGNRILEIKPTTKVYSSEKFKWTTIG